VTPTFSFCFSFLSSMCFASKGGYYAHNYKPKAARKGLLLIRRQPLCYSHSQLVPCPQHTYGCSAGLRVFFFRVYLLVLYLAKNYTVFLMVQLFCKNFLTVLKKSNEMTRHRRWKNSNICFKCHNQQRPVQ